MDKAGREYWDQQYQQVSVSGSVNLQNQGLNNYANQRVHELFRGILAGVDTKGRTLLEIGCGNSAWLPYFAKEYGFHVSGIDYSPQGCRHIRSHLAMEGIDGEIVCGNFFDPPQRLKGAFDVVVSLGVVEHFVKTGECLRACAEFLKPGGLMITLIPNMTGLIGMLQKLANRPVYDTHVPLDRIQLAAAHESGMELVWCRYFMFLNLCILNLGDPERSIGAAIGARLASWVTKGTWIMGRIMPLPPPNRLTAPYVVAVARKPCASPS